MATYGGASEFEEFTRHYATDGVGYTPLTYACFTGNLSIVNHLLDHEADPDELDNDGRSPLACAIMADSLEVIHVLSTAGVHVDSFEYEKEFCEACIKGNPAIVAFLLDKGADPDTKYDDWSAITLAAAYDHFDIVKLLLDLGANPEPYDNDGIGDIEELNSTMAQAVIDDNLELVKILINAGVNPSAQCGGHWGYSPIHIAAKYGYQDIVDHLLSIGVDCDLLDRNGRTPLSVACRYGMINIVDRMIEAGANIYGKSSHNITTLHEICAARHVDGPVIKHIIYTLYNNGFVNINIQTSTYTKSTPLHYAADSENKVAVETLIELGCDVSIENDSGEKADIQRFCS